MFWVFVLLLYLLGFILQSFCWGFCFCHHVINFEEPLPISVLWMFLSVQPCLCFMNSISLLIYMRRIIIDFPFKNSFLLLAEFLLSSYCFSSFFSFLFFFFFVSVTFLKCLVIFGCPLALGISTKKLTGSFLCLCGFIDHGPHCWVLGGSPRPVCLGPFAQAGQILQSATWRIRIWLPVFW